MAKKRKKKRQKRKHVTNVPREQRGHAEGRAGARGHQEGVGMTDRAAVIMAFATATRAEGRHDVGALRRACLDLSRLDVLAYNELRVRTAKRIRAQTFKKGATPNHVVINIWVDEAYRLAREWG